MIRFKCGQCGKKIGVPERHAGKRAKCPGCGQPVRIPEPKPEPAAAGDSHDGRGADALSALAAGESSALRSVEVSEQASAAKGVSDPSGDAGGGRRCPKCGAAANPNAKICIECGAGFGGMSAQNRVRTKKTAAFAGRTGFAILGGLATALACGVIWALVAKVTNRELGFLAWALGGGVGIATALIARRGGWLVGLGAALVSLLGWATAKALIAVWVFQPMFGDFADGWADGSFEREVYIVSRLHATGQIDDDLFYAWDYEEGYGDAEQQQIESLINAWVAEHGEPPPHPGMREAIAVEAMQGSGQIDGALYEAWSEGSLTAEQYAEIDRQVDAHYVSNPDDTTLVEYDEGAEQAFNVLVWIISLVGALSLWDLLWVPLMSFTAFQTAASAEVTVRESE